MLDRAAAATPARFRVLVRRTLAAVDADALTARARARARERACWLQPGPDLHSSLRACQVLCVSGTWRSGF